MKNYLLWKDREELAKQPVTPEEEERMINAERASGHCVCDLCGKKYFDHPQYLPSGKTNHGDPWLNELCNGDLVHL